jgi:hypothetical protein
MKIPSHGSRLKKSVQTSKTPPPSKLRTNYSVSKRKRQKPRWKSSVANRKRSASKCKGNMNRNSRVCNKLKLMMIKRSSSRRRCERKRKTDGDALRKKSRRLSASSRNRVI